MLTAESEAGSCQKVEQSFGLDAEEVLSLRTGWPLLLSAGPSRPQALLSAPCSFWKGPCSCSSPISAFQKLALCSGQHGALPLSLRPGHSWLPPASAGPASGCAPHVWGLPPACSQPARSAFPFQAQRRHHLLLLHRPFSSRPLAFPSSEL